SILRTSTRIEKKKWILIASSPWPATKNFYRNSFPMACHNNPENFSGNYGLTAFFLSRRNCLGGLAKVEGGCASPSRKLKIEQRGIWRCHLCIAVAAHAASHECFWVSRRLLEVRFQCGIGERWRYG